MTNLYTTIKIHEYLYLQLEDHLKLYHPDYIPITTITDIIHIFLDTFEWDKYREFHEYEDNLIDDSKYIYLKILETKGRKYFSYFWDNHIKITPALNITRVIEEAICAFLIKQQNLERDRFHLNIA